MVLSITLQQFEKAASCRNSYGEMVVLIKETKRVVMRFVSRRKRCYFDTLLRDNRLCSTDLIFFSAKNGALQLLFDFSNCCEVSLSTLIRDTLLTLEHKRNEIELGWSSGRQTTLEYFEENLF